MMVILTKAMRRQDRDAIRKIMAACSDYRSDGQTSMQEMLKRNMTKKMGIIPV